MLVFLFRFVYIVYYLMINIFILNNVLMITLNKINYMYTVDYLNVVAVLL